MLSRNQSISSQRAAMTPGLPDLPSGRLYAQLIDASSLLDLADIAGQFYTLAAVLAALRDMHSGNIEAVWTIEFARQRASAGAELARTGFRDLAAGDQAGEQRH